MLIFYQKKKKKQMISKYATVYNIDIQEAERRINAITL